MLDNTQHLKAIVGVFHQQSIELLVRNTQQRPNYLKEELKSS